MESVEALTRPMEPLTRFKRNMKVYIQILPPSDPVGLDNVRVADDNKTVHVRCVQDFLFRDEKNPELRFWEFQTDGVLNALNQESVFEDYIKPSLEIAFMGVDLVIFAYGQTGSGKSTTIHGLLNNYNNRGIAPRLISELFALKESVKHESKVKFQISFVEVYKNYMVDLLNEENEQKRENAPFWNISKQKIESEAEGWKYLFQGEARRNIEKNNNYYSNVATSIITIFIKSVSKVISNPVERYSKIHVIDMAGIDTMGNKSCESKKALHVGAANTTKTTLERCIFMIQDEIRNDRFPIKDPSPLIYYLGKSLDAHSLAIFFGHIRTESQDDLKVSISSLKFAHTIKKVKESKLNASVVQTPQLQVKNLQLKLDILQEQMYLNSMLKNSDLSFNLTQNRVEQIQHAIEEYIQNKTTEIGIMNVTDAIIALNIFRDIYNKLESDNLEALQKIQVLASKTKMMSASGRVSGATPTKPPESRPSIKRRNSGGRKMISDAASKASRHSYRHSITSGTTNKSYGVPTTLGQLLSSNYQGDPSKSLINKSKVTKNPSTQLNESPLKKNDQMYFDLDNFNLENIQTNDIEAIWKNYTKDISYNFEKINSTLQMIMDSSKDLLQQYNNLIDELNRKTEIIDFKKYDLLKLTLYQGMTSLQCAVCDDEEKHINETKERLSITIFNLIKDSIQIKEDILALLAELKIMVQEYHRNKKEMNKDFGEYCINVYHVKVPCSDQILESIEDDLATAPDSKNTENEIVDPFRTLFVKFQNILKRNRLVNNKCIPFC